MQVVVLSYCILALFWVTGRTMPHGRESAACQWVRPVGRPLTNSRSRWSCVIGAGNHEFPPTSVMRGRKIPRKCQMNQVRAAFAIEHDDINTQIIDRLTAFGIISGKSLGCRRELAPELPQCRRENGRSIAHPERPGRVTQSAKAVVTYGIRFQERMKS